MKIIAEIKNKYNTTKGADKKTLYDNLELALLNKYKGYTGYYVEIIPKGKADIINLLFHSRNLKKIGVSCDTIRRWEKSGIIKSSRSDSNYRLFDMS